MGYRSNVAIVTTRAGLGKIRAAWNGADTGYHVDLDEDAEVVELGESHLDGVAILWEDVKWYGGSPEVAAVEELISSDGFGEPYSFVRVGEEMGDYEHYYSVGSGVKGRGCPEELMCYPEMFIEIFDGCKRRMLLPHLDGRERIKVESHVLEPGLSEKLDALAGDARASLSGLSDGEFDEVARLLNAATAIAFDYCLQGATMYPLDADGVQCRPGDWVRYCTDGAFEANRYMVVAIGGEDMDTVYYSDGEWDGISGCARAFALRHDEELTPRRFLEWFGGVVTTVSTQDEAEALYAKAEAALRKVRM